MAVVAGVAVILLGLFLPRWQSEYQLPSERAQETATALNLGVTYLAVTPRSSAYYNLGVNSGALVTEVAVDSLAERAGIKAGDVILSFNGVGLEEGITLLGMMRACPAGNKIALEVWNGKSTEIVELVHPKW